MQARTAATFTLGFATGMAVLAIGLWGTGHLVIHQEVATAATSVSAPLAARATYSEPQFDHGERKQPTALPTPLPTPPPAPVGEADRAATNPPPANPQPSSPQPTSPQPTSPQPSSSQPSGAQLAMPLAGVDPAKLESNFAQARGGHAHEALDIMAARGTPVMAAAEGNVVKLFTSKQGGLTVYQFDNSQTWCYYYAHLDHYAPGLKEGVLLRKGEVLGYVGSTGDASPDAPHLHFAVFQLGPEKHWWQGTAVDPLPLLK